MKPGTAMMVILPLLLLAAAFVLVTSRGAGAADPHADGLWWDEDVVRFVRSRVARAYVDEVDDERAARAFYRAMDAYLRELDEYCDFIPPAEHRKWKEETRGEYAGLGIRIEAREDGLLVIGVLPGGPAAVAGVQVGDTVVAADGTSLAGLAAGTDELTRLLKGAPGSAVRLTLVAGPHPETGSATGARREVVATRAVVRPPTVFARRVGPEGRFGVVRIVDFADATADDVDRALKALLSDGVKALVLDLRDNGGGVLPAAVHVADRFLARGTIVRMEGRGAGASREHAAGPDTNDVPDAVPVAVLVNEASASASEVVAGALQDHRRAILVGERTFGKFLVQQVTDVPGRDAAVQITTSRYYTPSGRSYQRRAGERGRSANVPGEGAEPAGLLPDAVVPLDDAQKRTLRESFANEEGQPWGERPPFPDVPADHVDPQLKKATEILEGELVLRKIRRSAPRDG